MTPYKGITRVTCKRQSCTKPEKLIRPAAECVNCELAMVEVIDLDGKALAVLDRRPCQEHKLKQKAKEK